MTNYFENLGVTRLELEPGMTVMVPVGGINTRVNGMPCLIAWAVVRERADEVDGPDGLWWLDVYMSGVSDTALPQQYRAGEILGIPAWGLTMAGAPEPKYATYIG